MAKAKKLAETQEIKPEEPKSEIKEEVKAEEPEKEAVEEPEYFLKASFDGEVAVVDYLKPTPKEWLKEAAKVIINELKKF